MKLRDIGYAANLHLPVPSILYRVQRSRARPRSVAIGPLRLPPTGTLSGRFDLPDQPVGYFCDSDEAAVYGTLARREQLVMLQEAISARSMLTLRTTGAMVLLDLRPLTATFPVLQSLRYSETQELALDARAAGYSGVIYRSAQQYDANCLALFEPVLGLLRQVTKHPLRTDGGQLHRAVASAVRGSRLPLI